MSHRLVESAKAVFLDEAFSGLTPSIREEYSSILVKKNISGFILSITIKFGESGPSRRFTRIYSRSSEMFSQHFDFPSTGIKFNQFQVRFNLINVIKDLANLIV